MSNTFYFLIILTTGLIVRFLPISSLPFDSDQAIVGLMAKHFSQGEFSLLYYGDSYGGMLEPVLTSVFFHLFGMDRFVLHLIPFLISLLFLVSIYQLGTELFNHPVGLLSLLIAAIPLHYAGLYSALANGGYIEILWLGNVFLICCHRVGTHKEFISSPVFRFFFLGLLSGLAWWTHPLSLIYLASGYGFLVFKDRDFFLKGRVLFSALGFLGGSLPFWIWNSKNAFPFFSFIQSGEPVSYGTKLLAVGSNILDFFGLNLIKGQSSLSVYLFVFLILLSLFLLWIYKQRIEARFTGKQGPLLLWIFSLVFMSIYTGSRFSEEDALRYLLPVYSIFPISLAWLVYWIHSLNRFGALSLLTGILAFVLHGYSLSLGLYEIQKSKNYNRSQVETALFNFLRENYLRFSYTPEYWSGACLTFDSKEDLIFTQPFNDRYPLYTLMADASLKPAFVLDGKYIESFESMFQALGGHYKKQLFALYPGTKGYAVYYDFQPPLDPVKEVLPVRWKGSSNTNPEAVGLAFDRNLATGWSSSASQKTGMYFQIDLGALYEIRQLIFLPEKKKEQEFPGNYRLEISDNGKDWFPAASVHNHWAYLYWSLDRPFWKFRDGRTEYRGNWPKARFIRMTLTGYSPQPWTIGEILVYEAAGSDSREKFPIKEFLAFLQENNIRSVYADIGLSARITSLTQGKIKCLQDDYQLINVNDYSTKRYNEAFPFFNRLGKKVDFTLAPAFVVKKENHRAFEQTLQKLNGAFRIKVLGDYLICSHFKIHEPFPPTKAHNPLTAYYWNGTHLFLNDSPAGIRR